MTAHPKHSAIHRATAADLSKLSIDFEQVKMLSAIRKFDDAQKVQNEKVQRVAEGRWAKSKKISKGTRTARTAMRVLHELQHSRGESLKIEDLLKMVCYVKSQPPSSPSTQPMFDDSMPIVGGSNLWF